MAGKIEMQLVCRGTLASWQEQRAKTMKINPRYSFVQRGTQESQYDGNEAISHVSNTKIRILPIVSRVHARAQAVLEGAVDLFCGIPCEAAYALRSGGSGLRRALFRLERGRCQLCHLDCHDLIARLRCLGI